MSSIRGALPKKAHTWLVALLELPHSLTNRHYVQDLRRSGHIFSHLMDEYGNQEVDEEVSNVVSPRPTISASKKAVDGAVESVKSKIITQLMQAEERETGGITWTTYHEYLRYGGG
jgi:ATP-binding cassette subfamily C (CFTR/MRP) protein 1